MVAVLQRGSSASQRARAQTRQASTSRAPSAASAMSKPDRRLCDLLVVRRARPSVVGVPGVLVAGESADGPVGPVGVAPGAVVAPGVAGAVLAGMLAVGTEPVGVVEPGATVPGWAPFTAAGVVAAPEVPLTRAEAGSGILVPATVAPVAAPAAGAQDRTSTPAANQAAAGSWL